MSKITLRALLAVLSCILNRIPCIESDSGFIIETLSNMISNNEDGEARAQLTVHYNIFQETYFPNAPDESIEDVQSFITNNFPTSFRNNMANIQAEGVPDYCKKVFSLTVFLVESLYLQVMKIPAPDTGTAKSMFLDWAMYISARIDSAIPDSSVMFLYNCMIILNAINSMVYQVKATDMAGAEIVKAMHLSPDIL
uniref:AlNc14C56G4269 protein n=1 Tax=Albugo laibachii Nc14 TaxID=890382 RepID=F0WC86_9STRA|nr:AlNc14C56G4269 [Albugo laibachii Nc14]|eukprot:CCA18799.1 AlNc14C56G4269 [Albugo laibachii Nc14]